MKTEPVLGSLFERCLKVDEFKIMIDIHQGYLHGFPKQVPDSLLEWTDERYQFKDLDGYKEWFKEVTEGIEVVGIVRFYRVPVGGD